MATPKDIRESLPRRMAALNISSTNLSQYTEGVSLPTLSGFLNGARLNDRFDTVQHINREMMKLELLAAQCAPIPVDFRNVPLIKILVAKMSAGTLKIAVTEHLVFDTDVGGWGELAGLAGASTLAGFARNALTEVSDAALENNFKGLTPKLDEDEKQ